MRTSPSTASKSPMRDIGATSRIQLTESTTPQFLVAAPDDIVLGGRVRTKEDAEYLIEFFEMMKKRLPSKPAGEAEAPRTRASDDAENSGNQSTTD